MNTTFGFFVVILLVAFALDKRSYVKAYADESPGVSGLEKETRSTNRGLFDQQTLSISLDRRMPTREVHCCTFQTDRRQRVEDMHILFCKEIRQISFQLLRTVTQSLDNEHAI